MNMNPLDFNKIIQDYAHVSAEHPNALGEILRAWAFTGEGTGCYMNFDVRPDFAEVPATKREFAFLWYRAFDEDQSDKDGWSSIDAEEIKRIRWFKHPNGIEMGWHWDGDGTLAFYVPLLEDDDYNGVLYNGDCKKDYEWQFQWKQELR